MTRGAGSTGISLIPGLTESASVGHYEYQGVGMYFTWISCNPEDAVENFRRLTRVTAASRTRRFQRGRTAPSQEQSEIARRAGQRATTQSPIQRRWQLATAT